ncbi:H(+)/Cl(-) exchange transporter ClcA [Dyadobacter sp. CECT 9275]|uniref:H(+)/Cl(-) exchange transporter ClcA n=1 Tax=Dyadobacter helix TaxID=2822344 RepID=A0A916N4R0_9BACT|nr:chloride channel protein [Dyadobacter sp. CECT 9275]CAG4993025.1 H(+)/Cl(-) exchange transporter ClcA [Dyadobacter sp. CECT 9275]
MVNKNTYHRTKKQRVVAVILAAVVIGIISALIADTLKVVTEHYEHLLAGKAADHKYLLFLFPAAGFVIIHLLRELLLRNKPNKGIREVMDALEKKGKALPAYKIPSHYFNGFLTVIFGGSTGIEVSTVVATAALGGLPERKAGFLKNHRADLTCAGLAAGVTALFNAPLAGLFFALEVFLKKRSKLYIACLVAAVTSSHLVTKYFFYVPVFHFKVLFWRYEALPFFVLVGVFAGINAVYLSKSVIGVKQLFAKAASLPRQILYGSLAVSVLLFFSPTLYGEGYAGINQIAGINSISGLSMILPLLAAMLLKPIATSATLGVGGDGGVFAPSLFIGAFLGLISALTLNYFFHLDLMPVNFILIGMAAVLSGCIHAPFTAVFLTCAIADNFVLLLPLLLACFISKFVAKLIFRDNVYTYGRS